MNMPKRYLLVGLLFAIFVTAVEAQTSIRHVFQGGNTFFCSNAASSRGAQNAFQHIRSTYKDAVWVFYGNGEFELYANDRNMIPMRGQWVQKGKAIVFSSKFASTVRTGRTTIAVQGFIIESNGKAAFAIQHNASSINAARINGINFGSNSYNEALFTQSGRRLR